MKVVLMVFFFMMISSFIFASENPFFMDSSLPFHAPAFDMISINHYLPAFEAGMKQQKEEIAQIISNPQEATFENTIEAMEKTGAILTRVDQVFFNMTSANSNPEIQRIQAEIAPKLSRHSDDIYLNSDFFKRVKSLYEQKHKIHLSVEQQKLLEEYYQRFIRAGAMLTESQKNRVKEINAELSSLSTQFQTNILGITLERSVILDDKKELAGLSDIQIAGAAELAKSRGHEGKYMLSITNTTRQPITMFLQNRDARKRVWEASAYRGIGQNNGLDNRKIIKDIARLRAERAVIMGYPNWAAFTLEPQTAKTLDNVLSMLKNMVPMVVSKTKEEAKAISQIMKADGIEDEIRPWDWEYYAEKIRQKMYDLDENEIRPYFELSTVLNNGVFFTMNQLFGITFKKRSDLPVYHPDVWVYDVLDHDGTSIGLFYADYFARDSKRGGAWMSDYVTQSALLNKKPVVVNVMNIPKPAEGKPALISFDNVSTLFHEMGHAMHGLLSNVKYPSQSGTSVPRDFVEFPSTIMEDWAIHPQVLKNYARHYHTGEVIPKHLFDKLIAAKNFNQGFDTMEYLSATLLDFEWHMLQVNQICEDIEKFETEALKKYGLDFTPVPPRYKSAYFSHIFSSGYSASYYSYIWSEILAADGFYFMQDNGGLHRKNGDLLRKSILSQGGSKDPMDLYQDFRGQRPGVDALLIRRELKGEKRNR